MTKKELKEDKKQRLIYRLKNKDLKICGICGVANDGMPLKKSDAGVLKNNPQIVDTCESCKEGIASGVSMICLGENAQIKEPCNAFYVLDLGMIQKYVSDAEKGSSFEIYGCPTCSPDRKIHMTKESINKAYITFNEKK